MGKIFFNQYEALLNSGENVEVLAIGDSWFHDPANNLMSPLHRVLDHATTYVLGDNGERADSLCSGHWMRWLRQMASMASSLCWFVTRMPASTSQFTIAARRLDETVRRLIPPPPTTFTA